MYVLCLHHQLLVALICIFFLPTDVYWSMIVNIIFSRYPRLAISIARSVMEERIPDAKDYYKPRVCGVHVADHISMHWLNTIMSLGEQENISCWLHTCSCPCWIDGSGGSTGVMEETSLSLCCVTYVLGTCLRSHVLITLDFAMYVPKKVNQRAQKAEQVHINSMKTAIPKTRNSGTVCSPAYRLEAPLLTWSLRW